MFLRRPNQELGGLSNPSGAIVLVAWRNRSIRMTTLLGFVKRHYSFRWFLDTWTIKQKWMYVALYVIIFKTSIIPILVISETIGLLSEGSFLSLGVLIFLLVLWFAIYQPIFNFFMARDGNWACAWILSKARWSDLWWCVGQCWWKIQIDKGHFA